MERLKNKVAIITGGAQGIGAVAAAKFIAEKAKVIIWDLNSETAKMLANELGENASFMSVNVSDKKQVENAVAEIIKKHRKIDILINNAGITHDSMFHKMEEEQWDQVININLKGVFLCGQAVAKVMREQGNGVIVNTSSVVAHYGNFGQSNYVAAKSGIIGMTKVWAKELGGKGVRVHAVAPGFIATEMVKSIPEKVISMLEGKTPLGRLGQPEDIANAYLFLCSDEAAYITGAIINVDGGLALYLSKKRNILRNAYIAATGMAVPDRVIKNSYFDELLGEDVSTWLEENLTIKERRWLGKNESTVDLCEKVAVDVINKAGIKTGDLDLIIISTDTPEFISPSTASVLQHRLGAKRAGTFDINTACAGFVTALDVGSKYIRADENYNNVLVIGAYAMSKFLDKTDKKTVTLFADGAGAVLLQSTKKNKGFLGSLLHTEGQYNGWMGIYGGGSAKPISTEVVENNDHLLKFVRKFPEGINPKTWTKMITDLSQRIGISPNEIFVVLAK